MADFAQSAMIGAQISNMGGLRAQRQAELRSQESLRRFQERKIAQDMQFAAAEHQQKVKQWQDQIQFEADLTKAVGAMQADIEPQSFGGGDEGLAAATGIPSKIQLPGMAASDAALKHLMPIISAHSPKDVMPFMANIARLKDDERRTQMLGVPTPVQASQIEVNKERAELLRIQQETAAYKNEFGAPFTEGALGRDIGFIQRQNWPEEKKQKAIEIRAGLEPKATAAGEWSSRLQMSGLVSEKREVRKALDEALSEAASQKKVNPSTQETILRKTKRLREIESEIEELQTSSERPAPSPTVVGPAPTPAAPSPVQRYRWNGTEAVPIR